MPGLLVASLWLVFPAGVLVVTSFLRYDNLSPIVSGIILPAAVLAVGRELCESAKIDGAGGLESKDVLRIARTLPHDKLDYIHICAGISESSDYTVRPVYQPPAIFWEIAGSIRDSLSLLEKSGTLVLLAVHQKEMPLAPIWLSGERRIMSSAINSSSNYLLSPTLRISLIAM